MDVLITRDELVLYQNLGHRRYVDATCGKTSAAFCLGPMHIDVIVLNASHRAWRGPGKRFESIDEALEHYKSSAMRTMLETIRDLTKP